MADLMWASLLIIAALSNAVALAADGDWQQCLVNRQVNTLIWPNNTMAYNKLRAGFNIYYNKKPALIVLAQEIQDVQSTMRCVALFLGPGNIAIRSGGHNYAGYSSRNGGVLLHLGQMNRTLSVHADTRQATFQSGILLGALYSELWKYQLIAPGGTCATVGLGGHIQGGGFGYASRTFGLLSDSLVAAQVVLYNGTLVNASATENPLLFWALRGAGGGNFGVLVTATIMTTSLPEPIVRFNTTKLYIAWAHVAELLYAVQQWAPGLDRRLNLAMTVTFAKSIVIDGHWLGPQAELTTLLASGPLHSVAFDMFVGPYPTLNHDYGHGQAPHAFVAASRWIHEASPLATADFQALLELSARSLEPAWGIQFHVIGPGSYINQIPANATAFVHRATLMSMQYSSLFGRARANESRTHFERFDDLLATTVPKLQGAYVCYPDEFLRSPDQFMNAYYGTNARQLQQVKTLYDPTNLFSFEQSIPPLASTPVTIPVGSGRAFVIACSPPPSDFIITCVGALETLTSTCLKSSTEER